MSNLWSIMELKQEEFRPPPFSLGPEWHLLAISSLIDRTQNTISSWRVEVCCGIARQLSELSCGRGGDTTVPEFLLHFFSSGAGGDLWRGRKGTFCCIYLLFGYGLKEQWDMSETSRNFHFKYKKKPFFLICPLNLQCFGKIEERQVKATTNLWMSHHCKRAGEEYSIHPPSYAHSRHSPPLLCGEALRSCVLPPVCSVLGALIVFWEPI